MIIGESVRVLFVPRTATVNLTSSVPSSQMYVPASS